MEKLRRIFPKTRRMESPDPYSIGRIGYELTDSIARLITDILLTLKLILKLLLSIILAIVRTVLRII